MVRATLWEGGGGSQRVAGMVVDENPPVGGVVPLPGDVSGADTSHGVVVVAGIRLVAGVLETEAHASHGGDVARVGGVVAKLSA